MAHVVKCPICEKSFDRDIMENIYHNRRYYHKQCYNSSVDGRDKLFDYLRLLFGENLNMALINNQLKNYTTEQKFTYSGIMATLIYAFDVKGMDKNKSKGIGIVPFLYNEARQYYTKIAEAKTLNANTKITQVIETVEIFSPETKPAKNHRPIDIEKILGGFDNE